MEVTLLIQERELLVIVQGRMKESARESIS